MYDLVIQQFSRTLKNLDSILARAEIYASARKFDVNNFCAARLAPDMLPFVAQIRLACDHAKRAAANLAGKEAPQHEDNETTFEQLHARIAKCRAYLDTFTSRDFENTNAQTLVKLPNPKGKGMHAQQYLYSRQIPNFYFHVATAYNILRHGGVDIGKNDFLGPLDLVDA
jgi:uncharacterized protein